MRGRGYRCLVGFALVACGADPSASGAPEASAGGGASEPQAGLAQNPNEEPANEDGVMFTDGAGEMAEPPMCERVASFAAVEVVEAPPFDVIIVADHSGSLDWSRDDLAGGLGSLLNDVRGQQVRFFVLTPTQYGASTEAAAVYFPGAELPFNWSDPVTGAPYENAMTEYSASCTDPGGAARECPERYSMTLEEYTLRGEWSFSMPEPIAVLDRDASDAEVALQQQNIEDAITALGVAGAQQEQPLCTLNRYIQQPAAALPENAVFLVIADEDDTTPPADCLKAHSFQQTVVPGQSLTDCDADDCDQYWYHMGRQINSIQIDFQCVPVDDLGERHPELAVPGHFPDSGQEEPCATTDPQACTSQDLALVAGRCDVGSELEQCVVTCVPDAHTESCTLTRNDAVDICSEQFTAVNQTYASLAGYCEQLQPGSTGWSDCSRQGFYREATNAYNYELDVELLVEGASSQDLVTQFSSDAQAAFGENGYYVATIVFDSRFSCEPQPGQGFAPTLNALTRGPEDIFPICESYAPTLSAVRSFATHLLQNEYTVELLEDEHVEAVVITNGDDAQRELEQAQFSYDTVSQTLTIDPAALSPADVSLEIELVAECRRVIR